MKTVNTDLRLVGEAQLHVHLTDFDFYCVSHLCTFLVSVHTCVHVHVCVSLMQVF